MHVVSDGGEDFADAAVDFECKGALGVLSKLHVLPYLGKDVMQRQKLKWLKEAGGATRRVFEPIIKAILETRNMHKYI